MSILIAAGLVVGQVIYFSLISFAWKAIGWQFNDAHSHFLGILSFLSICITNPFICALFSSYATFKKGKIFTVNVCILLFAIVLICTRANEIIWLNASGYYKYLLTPGSGAQFPEETLAWNQILNSIQLLISGVIFIGSYSIIMKRRLRVETKKLLE